MTDTYFYASLIGMETKAKELAKLSREREALAELLKNAERQKAKVRLERENLEQVRKDASKALADLIKRSREHRFQAQLIESDIKDLRNILAQFEAKENPFAIVVDFLAAGVETLTELCHATGLKNTAVSKFLRSMEMKGMVKRVLAPGQKQGAKYILTLPDSRIT